MRLNWASSTGAKLVSSSTGGKASSTICSQPGKRPPGHERCAGHRWEGHLGNGVEQGLHERRQNWPCNWLQSTGSSAMRGRQCMQFKVTQRGPVPIHGRLALFYCRRAAQGNKQPRGQRSHEVGKRGAFKLPQISAWACPAAKPGPRYHSYCANQSSQSFTACC